MSIIENGVNRQLRRVKSIVDSGDLAQPRFGWGSRSSSGVEEASFDSAAALEEELVHFPRYKTRRMISLRTAGVVVFQKRYFEANLALPRKL